MKIHKKDNINYTGIKLSNSSFVHAREVAMHLKRTGFDVLGHRTFYVNNDFNDKRKLFSNIRYLNNFSDRECGVIFLPWSAETYVISTPSYEQFMLPVVKTIDKRASINWLM